MARTDLFHLDQGLGLTLIPFKPRSKEPLVKEGSYVQFFDADTAFVDPTPLLPQLLDQLAVLGDFTHQISHGLGEGKYH